MIKNFVFGGNYFARGEFVLYINHSGKYIEINFNMKIPFSFLLGIALGFDFFFNCSCTNCRFISYSALFSFILIRKHESII